MNRKKVARIGMKILALIGGLMLLIMPSQLHPESVTAVWAANNTELTLFPFWDDLNNVLIPEIAVDPTSFDLTVVLGQSVTVPMSVANSGDGALNFQIFEMDGGNVPDFQSGYGLSVLGTEQSQSPENDNGSTVLSGPSVGTQGSFTASALTDPWLTISPMPQSVSRPAGAVVDGLLHVVGGESSGGLFGQVQIYDPATELWDNVSAPAMPTPVSNLCAVALDDQIYVPGGWTGAVVGTALQVFDTTTNSWQTIATDPLPAARYGSGCASHDGKLYVFGGWDGSAPTDTAWIYDPAAGAGARWSTLANAPFTGVYGAALAVNGLIFYGGVTFDRVGGNFDYVAAYNPVADDWTSYPSLQTARGAAGMWAIDDTLYIGGGGWSTYLTTVEAYDTTLGTAGSWQFTNELNQGRRTFAYATDSVNGHLYAAGGWAGAFLAHAEIAPVYGVLLPADMSASGEVGTTVTYTIQITNTGNVSDTFDLAVTGETWTTTPGSSSVMLAAGASASVTVPVLIPASAADGESDVATITAVSQTDSGVSDSLTLTTTAVVPAHYIYLPIIFKP